MPALNRRAAIKGVLTSVAVPAVISGCANSPAAAAICKAVPYVPPPLAQDIGADGAPDAKLFALCAQFHRLDKAEAAVFERYCSLPTDSQEAKAISAEFEGRYAVWAAVSDACYEAAPRTPAGAAALLDVIFARDSEYIDEAVQKPLKLIRDCLKAMAEA
ncbi:hypothetical protein QO058_09270 [Bosea vestrisii]|uniref:hypothetical protein n=1 Tax=Bosea vestrisii TaxID=151416 RepID=UPI0024E01AA3|nr:hypothetical protein [Bosea vestrisii]WID98403.1 hypothetical protein QO058_09270 [Bosea vestrisii]